MARTTTPSLPPYVDNPDAPVIFVDELTGGGIVQGNLNLTFAVLQYDHSGSAATATPYRCTCLRLIIPVGAMVAASQFVGRMLQNAAAAQPPAADPQNVH